VKKTEQLQDHRRCRYQCFTFRFIRFIVQSAAHSGAGAETLSQFGTTSTSCCWPESPVQFGPRREQNALVKWLVFRKVVWSVFIKSAASQWNIFPLVWSPVWTCRVVAVILSSHWSLTVAEVIVPSLRACVRPVGSSSPWSHVAFPSPVLLLWPVGESFVLHLSHIIL